MLRGRICLKMLLLLVLLTYVEGRVYCEDSHAMKWEPLGYSCPINCANVITALNKLESLDYIKLFTYKNNLLNRQIDNIYATNKPTNDIEVTESNKDYVSNITEDRENDFRRNENDIKLNQEIKIYKSYFKALNNERVAQDLRNEFGKNKECYSQNDVKFNFVRAWNKRCFRRSVVENDFLKKFTDILNRYTHSVPFTEELTDMILKKILGKNLDLRHGMIDVKKIIEFLSKAIRYHEQHMEKGDVINLKSRRCLTINVMGCYCMPGFVEKFGQCVMPTDCFEEVIEKELLARIIVH